MEYIVGVQLGAILAVFTLYPHRIWQIINELLHFKGGLWIRIFIITIPSIVIGSLLHFFYDISCVSLNIIKINLIAGGILMLIFRRKSGHISSSHDITKKSALIIGLFQSISFIPGVSRSLSVIFGGLATGFSRKLALEISFISGIPIIFCASMLEIYSSYSQGFALQSSLVLLAHMMISFIFAYIGIIFLKYLTSFKKDFEIFGVYRIAIGVLLFAIM